MPSYINRNWCSIVKDGFLQSSDKKNKLLEQAESLHLLFSNKNKFLSVFLTDECLTTTVQHLVFAAKMSYLQAQK